jgi:hypothetical protein
MINDFILSITRKRYFQQQKIIEYAKRVFKQQQKCAQQKKFIG